MVDSTAGFRISELKESIWKVLNLEVSKCIPVMLLANKQDLPGALRAVEVAEKLDFYELEDRKWLAEETSGKEGIGVIEAFEKLEKLLRK